MVARISVSMKPLLVAFCVGSLAAIGTHSVEAAPMCSTAAFPVGSLLPEPSGAPIAARIFELSSGTGATASRVGTVYETARGAAFFQAETGEVSPRARTIEIAFLEAAGYAPPLARQYTHPIDMPAVPLIAHPFDLARRLGLRANRCA